MANWSEVKDRLGDIVIPLGSAAVNYYVARVALEFATQRSIIFGVFMACLVLFLAVTLTRWARHKSRPTSSVLGGFLTAVVLACVVGAWASYVIYQSAPWRYEVPADASFSTFIDHYAWTFIDMIPGFDVWKTLRVHPNVVPVDALAGSPVLAFRVFVIICVLGSIKSWWKEREATQHVVGPERG